MSAEESSVIIRKPTARWRMLYEAFNPKKDSKNQPLPHFINTAGHIGLQ